MKYISLSKIGMITGISLALLGCGGEDNKKTSNNNNSGTTPNNITFKYSVFDREYGNNSVEFTNIIREDYTFANGGVTLAIKGLIKPYVNPVTNEGYDYEIGENYLEKHLDNDNLGFIKNVTVNQPSIGLYKVNFQTLGENNKVTNRSMTFKEIDISGVFDFALKEKQGLNLWVDNFRYKKLPAVVTFPAGSSCYASAELTQDKVTYGFEDANQTTYTNLDNFLVNEGGVVTSSIKKTNVGLNNEWQVAEYITSNNTDKRYAVFYNGKVYKNAYKSELKETQNVDITKEVVDCDLLNPTAANYIEQELLKVYK